MAVRVAKFEVSKVLSGDHKEAFRRWWDLADQCQEIVNFIWEQWLVWHVQNKSAGKIRQYLDALAVWREKGKKDTGTKPKLDLQAVSNDLNKAIYAALAKEFPEVNARVRTLLQNITQKKIKERKATKGNLSGWMVILLHRESLPSSTKAQPIPFDVANASLLSPLEDDGNYRLRMRLDRIERKGKPATATLEEVELWSKGRKMQGQRSILNRVLSGEFKFCGSMLRWDAQNRKWLALVCYQMPGGVAEIDSDKTAILRPALKHPWTIRLPSGKRWRQGSGRYIGTVRQQLLTQRWSRQDGYRYAGSSNKGHGRDRALRPIWQLSQRWKDFVKTCNHRLTSEAVKDCVREGVGTLIYFQPVGKKRDKRFLSTAGKVPGREDSTGWDWHQVGTMLDYKCQEAGVKLIVQKCGEAKVAAK